MKDFLFLNFHETIDGESTPYFSSLGTGYQEKLGQYLSRGISPHLCYRARFFRSDKGGTVHAGHSAYWHKDHWRIFPEPLPEALPPIPVHEMVPLASDVIGQGAELKGVYRSGADCLELIVEPDIHGLGASALRFHYYNILFRETCDAIKKTTASVVYSDLEKKQKKRFVRGMQESALRYADKVRYRFGKVPFDWHRTISDELSETDIFRLMLQYLDGLLLYIYENYGDCADPSLSVPYGLRAGYRFRMDERAARIERGLKGSPLGKVTGELLATFYDLDRAVPFSRLEVSMHLLEKCDETLQEEADRTEKSIMEALTHHFKTNGLNSPTFIYFLKSGIEDALEFFDEGGKADFLKESLKCFEKLRVGKKPRFRPDLPPLHEQMTVWISEMLEACGTLDTGTAATVPKPIRFNDSVAVLGVILRSVYEAGMFDWESKAKLALHVSRTVSSQGSDRLSEKNLYNSIMYPGAKAADRAQEYLINMHDIIEALKVS